MRRLLLPRRPRHCPRGRPARSCASSTASAVAVRRRVAIAATAAVAGGGLVAAGTACSWTPARCDSSGLPPPAAEAAAPASKPAAGRTELPAGVPAAVVSKPKAKAKATGPKLPAKVDVGAAMMERRSVHLVGSVHPLLALSFAGCSTMFHNADT